MNQEKNNQIDISGIDPDIPNKDKKLSFWKRIWISIKDFDKYQIFALEGLGKSIKYLLQLMLIFTILITAGFTYQFSIMLQNGSQYFQNEIPDLHFENNLLTIDQQEPIILNELQDISGVVIIDTISDTEEIDKEIETLKTYDNGILILKDKIMIKNAMTNLLGTYQYTDLVQQYSISESFTKQDVLNYLTSINYMNIYAVFFAVTWVYMFILYFTSTLVDSIMLAALGYITSYISRVRFKFKPILNMAIHALTLPILLNMLYIIVNITTGFEIRYFQVMYTTISYIYMVTAILMIKSDIIKQQMELNALKAEQQRIREELKAEEERKRLEQEEQERRKRREEKKKEKEKEKEKEEKPNDKPNLNPSGNET